MKYLESKKKNRENEVSFYFFKRFRYLHGSCYSYLQWRQSCWWKNYAIPATADCYHVSIPLPKSFDICILQLNIKKTFDPDDFNIIHFCGDDIPTYLAWMHNLYFTFLCSFKTCSLSKRNTFISIRATFLEIAHQTNHSKFTQFTYEKQNDLANTLKQII